MGNDITSILTLFFAGCILVLVVTHSTGFASSMESVFTGINDLGASLTNSKPPGEI
jgi:hypothetical protein